MASNKMKHLREHNCMYFLLLPVVQCDPIHFEDMAWEIKHGALKPKEPQKPGGMHDRKVPYVCNQSRVKKIEIGISLSEYINVSAFSSENRQKYQAKTISPGWYEW